LPVASVEANLTLDFEFVHFADKNAGSLESTVVEAQELEVDVPIFIFMLTILIKKCEAK
jgi:hypothetical protein